MKSFRASARSRLWPQSIGSRSIGWAANSITTGRKLAEGLPHDAGDVVVMLDGDCSFKAIGDRDIDIYWGAYPGTEDQILVAGPLASARMPSSGCGPKPKPARAGSWTRIC